MGKSLSAYRRFYESVTWLAYAILPLYFVELAEGSQNDVQTLWMSG